ncbi:dihydropteroate synthase, partial [Paraburkholderia sp. SIMBA_027]
MWLHTGPFCIHQRLPPVSDSAVSAFIPAPLQCGRFSLTFERPLVMGILNATPDSFSDGGRFLARDDALRQAE